MRTEVNIRSQHLGVLSYRDSVRREYSLLLMNDLRSESCSGANAAVKFLEGYGLEKAAVPSEYTVRKSLRPAIPPETWYSMRTLGGRDFSGGAYTGRKYATAPIAARAATISSEIPATLHAFIAAVNAAHY